jgi:aspartate kinase
MVVMKFGGTSLGRKERLEKIPEILERESEKKKIIVVSAISGKTKREGTTSKLLLAIDIGGEKAKKILDEIAHFHTEFIDNIIEDEETRKEMKRFITKEINFAKDIIPPEGIKIPVITDDIIAIGERFSAYILYHFLHKRNINVGFCDLSSVYPKRKSQKVPKGFWGRLQKRIGKKIREYINKYDVVVATGYIGSIPGGIIESIGRGYSDYTSALISADIMAKELQIWKEVDGIYSTDPNKVEDAFVLPKISYEEAAEMAYFGAEALHPKTIEPCIENSIPIRIKNIDKPDFPGTIVSEEKQYLIEGPKAITLKENITIITVSSNRMLDAPGFIAEMGEIYKKHNISIDLMATSEVSVSCSIYNLPSNKLEELLEDLRKIGRVSVIRHLNSISVIGHGMQMTPGIAGKVFSLLGKHKINIILISQGASELSISFVVDEKDGLKALKLLHNIIKEEWERAKTQ